jgi:type II secretory pathway pseudopilin PulG
MKLSHTRKKHDGGYILLEVMLATAIFSMTAVALAVVLSDAISVGSRAQSETRITWALESKLNEARLVRIEPGMKATKPDGDGVTYETQISQLNMTNQKGQPLPGMYNIVVTARWRQEGQNMSQVAQTYAYQP